MLSLVFPLPLSGTVVVTTTSSVLLLDHGADPVTSHPVPDSDGRTPLSVAVREGYSNIIWLLLGRGQIRFIRITQIVMARLRCVLQ